ncbi:MAG: VWA domain-containing protein [Vicinamibacterales bacterium]|nr:VWA domain-containing protein [Vicinamibacterales bacterium]
MKLRLVGASLGVVWLLPATGMETRAQNAPAVTFQTEITYVDLDVTVTDQQGRLIGDLVKEDFEIFEDGKPQKVEMFSYVEIQTERPDRFLVSNRPVASDVRSNRRAFDGRVYLIVLDDLDISPIRTATVKRSAREFVERHFGANDMAAVVYTSGRTDASQEFTSDPGLLVAAIDKFVGRRLRSAAVEVLEMHYFRQMKEGVGADEAVQDTGNRKPGSGISDSAAGFDIRDSEREQRTMAMLDTLRNLGELMSSVRGRRKAVLLFSEGVEMPMSELLGSVHTGTDVVGGIKDAITAAARSNVSFFTLDPRGLTGLIMENMDVSGSASQETTVGAFGSLNAQQALLTEMRVSQDSLRVLSEETGGFAAVNTNDLGSAFGRIVDASSRYYVLGYYPPAHPQDGRFHKIDVRVKRPGLNVSARKGYASPHSRTARERKRDEEARRLRDMKRGGAGTTSAELRDVLNAPMQQGGLAFSLQAAPFRDLQGSQREASVALAIEFDGDRFPFPEKDGLFANRLELTFFGIGGDGRAQRTTRSEFNLNLRPDTYRRVKANGLRLNPRISLAPGRYQVRVGARESATGSIGSVFYDLQVPDFQKEPLTLSGLLLTAPSAGGAMTALADPAAVNLLPGPATSRRGFLRSDTLTVFAELYDNQSQKQARQIDTSVTLLSEDGQEVFSARDVLTNGGSAKSWSAFGLTRDISLKDIQPGRYLLRVEAAPRGTKDATPAARETLITVSGP